MASGSVPLAHGNDGMGSLRLPAAACGLVTLKPGRGVVPAEIGADSWSGMAENGALATTVADLAVAHAVMAGEEPRCSARPGRPLRIALSTRSPVPGVRADGATRAAVDAAVAALLTEAGHTVVRKDPPITTAAAAGAMARWMVGAEKDAEHLGLDRAALQPRSRTHARIGRLVAPDGARPAADRRARSGSRWSTSSSDVDVLLSPGDDRAPAAGPAVARAVLHGQHHGQRALGAVDRRLEPGRACRRWSCPAGVRPGGAARWRSSSSAPRVPKGDYSGWPESWSAGSRGAATRPSSIPPPPPVAAPV